MTAPSADQRAESGAATERPALLDLFTDVGPYALGAVDKRSRFDSAMAALTAFHYAQCAPYRQLLDLLGQAPRPNLALHEVPFVPVRLFKHAELRSVPAEGVVKTMTSSGTSGQGVSRIFLDKQTAVDQTRVLTRIVSSFIGNTRLPMLVVDSPSVVRDRKLFSARGAGILGFSMFGRDVMYALGDDMHLDLGAVQAFAERHAGREVLVFGFTFIIWQHLWAALSAAGIRLPLDKGTMIHGGGWKKLTELAVSPEQFRRRIGAVSGITRVLSYYGMVEQTGSIFMECERGHLHASVYSDVLIRDHRDFSVVAGGEAGLVQLLSVLPGSYPGHSILTEDVGRILGEDDCPCGRLGKYIEIHGRVKNAEIRGCSDVYAAAPAG